MKTQSHRLSSQRGSVLLLALVFAIIIALFLGGYLKLTVSSMDTAQRSFFYQSLLSTADGGIEQALWSVNTGGTSAWDGWSTVSPNGRRTTFDMDLGQNSTAHVNVWVEEANPTSGTTPTIVAKATVTPPGGGPPMERWVKVTARRQGAFTRGLVGRESVTFNGNGVTVDSYNSDLGAYNAALTGGGTNKYDHGSVGVLNASNGAMSVGNGQVWGVAAIAASDATAISGNHAIVGPYGSTDIVASAVQTNFTATFPDISAPTPAVSYTVGALGVTTLPRSGDLPNSDGYYYYNISGISLSGNASKVLHIDDKVVLINANALNGISVTGQASISLGAQGDLQIYTAGTVSIGGNGVTNENAPVKCAIWSTLTTASGGSQSISVSGNGVLSAVVYAPNATLSLNGGGSGGAVFGSMIGKTITLNGGAEFHYDEALGSAGNLGAWTIQSWTELSKASERAGYASQLNF
ncbi:MAG: hypothetical protein WC378_01915 [Opitutaceae bacterium]|jgi:hypothetical protein